MDRSGVVVVAIPCEEDPVWKYSSEDVPHLTLLYLGENNFNASQAELITGYVEHAASTLYPFYLQVEERGELGDKNADVLFFSKNWTKDIARFRSQLLGNDLVMSAYQSADQFPQWTPHLTMGYPDNPAKKDDRDYPDPNVKFDRIALWFEESEGPTFKLKNPDYDMGVLSHAETDFDLEEEYGGLLDLISSYIGEIDEVKHYGIKGMKWGVRKSETKAPREQLKSLGPDSVSRKTASGETITLKKMQPTKLHNLMGRMSKKYREEYSKGASLDILDGNGKKVGDAVVEKKNDEELYLNWLGIKKSARGKGYATAVMKAGRDFGKQQGFKRMTLEVPGNSPDARHIYEKLGFKVTKEAVDTNDFWGGLTEMAYEFDTAQSTLSHYGVKGMKWGVRKAETEDSSARSPRSEDARNFEKNARKIQTHGTSALSNKELQSVINRINMENQYHNLTVENRDLLDVGNQQAKKILAYGETVERVRKFMKTPTGKAIKKGFISAATVGVAYATGGAGPAAAAGAQVAVRRMNNHYTNVG